MRILVPGGAGFIGSHFIRYTLRELSECTVTNLDKLTYAGNLDNLRDVMADPRYRFVKGDIADPELVASLFREGVDAVVNFAAESHVDRSVLDAAPFVKTNVLGAQVLLDAACRHGVRRFIQVSTDEVYGPAPEGVVYSEESSLMPSSPYAASKAAADLLCLAYHKTHGLPLVITRCTNNYGPFQFPEKFIPLTITNALEGVPIPIYGDGCQQRDWLFVEDHCAALMAILLHIDPGTVLNIASGRTVSNLVVAQMILDTLDVSSNLLHHVEDRPAHDRRYAIAATKIAANLGWRPQLSFEDGLARTVGWYRQNKTWWQAVKAGDYQAYYRAWYGSELKSLSRRWADHGQVKTPRAL